MTFSKFTKLCNDHCKLVLDHSHHPNMIPHGWLQIIPIPSLSPRQPAIYFLFLSVYLFCTFHVREIIQHVVFSVWLLSLTTVFFCFNFYLFIYLYLFLAVLGLRFCARAFSSCGERGPLFIAVRGPLTVVASLVADHKLQTLRLSSCGSRAWLFRSMWDLPRPGLEPVSPALAGRFSTTAPSGKPNSVFFFLRVIHVVVHISTLFRFITEYYPIG